MDLPLIKPKTNMQGKNEFSVNIEKIAPVETYANMEYFTRPILQDWEQSDTVNELL